LLDLIRVLRDVIRVFRVEKEDGGRGTWDEGRRTKDEGRIS
jgi:hypothetical protein